MKESTTQLNLSRGGSFLDLATNSKHCESNEVCSDRPQTL